MHSHFVLDGGMDLPTERETSPRDGVLNLENFHKFLPSCYLFIVLISGLLFSCNCPIPAIVELLFIYPAGVQMHRGMAFDL